MSEWYMKVHLRYTNPLLQMGNFAGVPGYNWRERKIIPMNDDAIKYFPLWEHATTQFNKDWGWFITAFFRGTEDDALMFKLRYSEYVLEMEILGKQNAVST